VSEPEFLREEKKIDNPQDTPDDYRNIVENIVSEHFDQTERVLSEFKAVQEEGLQEL
jgi:hypothetical protein